MDMQTDDDDSRESKANDILIYALPRMKNSSPMNTSQTISSRRSTRRVRSWHTLRHLNIATADVATEVMW